MGRGNIMFTVGEKTKDAPMIDQMSFILNP
jgi:hypothetical protein